MFAKSVIEAFVERCEVDDQWPNHLNCDRRSQTRIARVVVIQQPVVQAFQIVDIYADNDDLDLS